MTTYARCLYPGIVQQRSCVINFGQGLTPTGFELEIAPQPEGSIVEIGTLRLEYADKFLEFRDCRVDHASFLYDTNGNVTRITIHDRRWRWKLSSKNGGGRINGEYNVRQADGTLRKMENGDPTNAIEYSEREPQTLAIYCLTAAGEELVPGAVDALPNDARPYVDWDAANAMSELHALAESLGCRVALCLDDKVRIFRAGEGIQLPAGGKTQFSGSVSYFDMPDMLSLITGPVRFELDLELEMVGLDVDGNWKLNDDLSYKPSGGWQGSDLMTDYAAVMNDRGSQNVAMKTVFRTARIKQPINIPIFGFAKRREQLILLGAQVHLENAGEGVRSPRSPMVYGKYFRAQDPAADNSIAQVTYLPDDAVEKRLSQDPRVEQIVDVGFSLDPDRWLVHFGGRIWALDDEGLAVDPELRLRVAVHVRREGDGRIERRQVDRTLATSDSPAVLDLLHDEIIPTVTCQYSESFAPINVVENWGDILPEIEFYLSQKQSEFAASKSPSTCQYQGWRFDIPLDGAIQSLTWTLAADNSGPLTLVQRNQDVGVNGTPYRLTSQYLALARARSRVARREWSDKRRDEINAARGPQV